MFTVYVLFSKSHQKIYIGFTSNLENRMISHNQLGKKGYTLKYRPWEVIYSEVYKQKSDAMKREKQLKSAQGRAFIKNVIEGLISVS